MACNHRFIEELIPEWEIEYLFVGTFNPEWDKSSNNASYFYGRHTNHFWYIMPQVFRDMSLMDKEYRNNKKFLKDYLKSKKIGLTDLIRSIEDAENKDEHRRCILSYRDKDLEKFKKIKYNEEIFNLIDKNLQSLKKGGVFLTRQIGREISQINEKWEDIKRYCKSKGIKVDELVTPSIGYRSNGYNRNKKLEEWKNIINPMYKT
jgi:G:T/U-mismatch repair DNA glycosylase